MPATAHQTPAEAGPVGGLEVVGPTLTLRYATFADAPALFELGRDAVVTRFFSWGPYQRIAEAEAYIAGLAAARSDGRLLDFLVVAHDAGPIGVTGLSELSRRDRRATIGSWLARDRWGTGANTESKALVCALAFRVLGIERLTAYANVANPRSQAALEKVGFQREGLLRRWHRHGEDVHDVVISSLLRDEWAAGALAAVPTEVRGAPPRAFVVA